MNTNFFMISWPQKRDTDKYKYIGLPQAEQPLAVNQGTKTVIVYPCPTKIGTSFYHFLVRKVLREHYELWELLKEGRKDYTNIFTLCQVRHNTCTTENYPKSLFP